MNMLVSLRQIPLQFTHLPDKLTLQTIIIFLLLITLLWITSLSQWVFLFKWNLFSCIPCSNKLQKKGLFYHLLKAWSGYRFVCVVCGQLWSLHGCCCRCCGCFLIMSLWHWAAVILADRQALALVTAASCHLGPCTERGGQGHANGRTRHKVIHTLAYWLAHCLIDWLGFLSQGWTGQV